MSGCVGGGDDIGSAFDATTFTFSINVGAGGGGAVEGLDRAGLDRAALRGGLSWGKRESFDGDTVNFTMRLDFGPLPERSVAGGVETLDSEVEPRRREVVFRVFPPMVCYNRVSPLRSVLPAWS